MKNLFYILIALVMGVNFTSCSVENLEESEELYTNVFATEGDDEQVIDEPDGD